MLGKDACISEHSDDDTMIFLFAWLLVLTYNKTTETSAYVGFEVMHWL